MTTTTDRPPSGLQTIFSFFLGLMALAFIGVGVNTLYPSPAEKYTRQERDLSLQEEVLSRKASPGNYTAADQAELERLSRERNRVRDEHDAATRDWARVTSIVIVIFATVVLAVSLLLSERLRVIANGLLLGGLFSMVYGVGWVLASGSSMARFWVITFALAVALALGYWRFVRGRRRAAPHAAPAGDDGRGPAADATLADLTSRVSALEERARAAASALAGSIAADPRR